MSRRAAWEVASDAYPSTKSADWVTFFDESPEVVWQILGDIAKVYVATDETSRRVGRRPAVPNMSLDDLQKIIQPRFSMDPFTVSLPELIGARSQRAFAARVPCDHKTLQRFIAGTHFPTKEQYEAFARAARVTPAYFREWRAMFVAEALATVYEKHPNLSIAAYKRLAAMP